MFLLSQNDENQSENGSKNSKIRLRARPPAEPQKKMLQTKKLRSKSWKTRVFFTFRLPILDGRVHEQVSSVLFFYSVFWRRASRPIKNRRFWPKNGTPPPGKPVTFYECHPDDRAPAPSVRADFYTWIIVFIDGLLLLQGDFYYKWITIKIKKGLHMDCNWIMLWMDCKWIQCKWIVLWIIDVLMVKLVGWSRPDI